MTMQPPKEELSPYESPDGVALFSDKVIDRLTAMSASQTCCLVSSDGTTKYPVHQAKLQEQSKVLRGLLSDVAFAGELPLQEDAATVRLLISGMYDTYSQVTPSTIRLLLELARKYDVEDIRLNCESFLNTADLYSSTIPCYLELACTFDMKFAVERCLDFVNDDHIFEDTIRWA